MSKVKEPAFLYVGVYDDEQVARDDLEMVRDLHDANVIGTFDAAIAKKDDDGDVKIKRTGSEHPGWGGAAVGAVVGLLFPPSILGMAAAGGAAGGLIGHFSHSLSKDDVEELGEALEPGELALIVVGKNKLADELDKAGIHAQKRAEKRLDIESSELEMQLPPAAQAGA